MTQFPSTINCTNFLFLQITDDDDEAFEEPHFGDHTYNETFEATDDTKYETITATA